MATIEVHDGEGRVQFVGLSRDHPFLFGTSTACDVVMEGDGIRPVHGRIRWKSRRFKIEASPDAQFVLINGHKMTTASARQGDEITVGPYRMFVLQVDDDQESATVAGRRPDDGRTQVLPPPALGMAKGVRPQGRSHERTRTGPRGESVLEREDWLGSLKREPSPDRGISETFGSVDATHAGRGRDAGSANESGGRIRALGAWIERLRSGSTSAAPGRERILSSPLVIGLVLSLSILLGMGVWLKAIIDSTIATRMFNSGVEKFEDGDYRTSMRDFDAFLEANPEDPRAGKARVLRAFANLRQYVSPDGGTWSSALEAANEMMERVGGEEEFRDERMDLAELIIRIGEGLADRARASADAKALAEAESAVRLHAQVAGEPALSFLNRSRLPAKLDQARAVVLKARIRSQTLEKMDRALASAKGANKTGNPVGAMAGDGPPASNSSGAVTASPSTGPASALTLDVPKDDPASRVYEARDALVDQYPDLAHDPALIQRMTAANELIREAVTVDRTRRTADVQPRIEPLGPPTSLVFRTMSDSSAATTDPDGIVFALADGFGYAIDGKTGAPLWHVPLGLASPFVPQPVAGDGTVLAFDARHHELVRFNTVDGSLRWRLDVGASIQDPPLVLGNQLVQVIPGGRVLLIALESGELQATVNLGRPLARPPVHDDSGRLYVLGRQDCLFVLSRDPLACIAVNYLGQLDGAIPCAPARLGRFLVVPENNTMSDSRWHILIIDEDAKKIRPVQDVEVSGWTWQTPASSGSIIWANGDKGGYEALAIGDEASKQPFRTVARLTSDATASGPAFALARSERELWVASGHSGRFVLDPERAEIVARSPLAQPGPALAPIQAAGKHVVMTFQDRETGGVALWGIDPESGAVDWKTIVGVPWPTPLTAVAGSSALSTFGRDGRAVGLSRDQIARGGFVTMVLPRPGDFALPPGFRLEIARDGKTSSAIVPHSHRDMLWIQDAAPPGWRKIGLPSALAANPLVWDGAVLVPGADARAYLIDPFTAESRAEPFVPKFDRDRQGAWLAPTLLDRDNVVLADRVGRVARIALKKTPVARLSEEAETTLDQRIIADPASTGGAVIVATADGKVRALAARDLSPVGSWPLAAPLAGPLFPTKDGCFLIDRARGVMAFGRDGQRIWSITLPAEVVGAPLVDDQSVRFVTADGSLYVRARSDGGPIDQMTLGVLPSGGLLEVGGQALISSARGTIRPLKSVPSDATSP